MIFNNVFCIIILLLICVCIAQYLFIYVLKYVFIMNFAQKANILYNTFLSILLIMKKIVKKYCKIRFYMLYYNHRERKNPKQKPHHKKQEEKTWSTQST